MPGSIPLSSLSAPHGVSRSRSAEEPAPPGVTPQHLLDCMRRAPLILSTLILAACHMHVPQPAPVTAMTRPASPTPPPMAVTLAPRINAAQFLRFDRVLSSDAFEGRKPVTRGEVLTTRYLIEQLKRMGLAPGNHGSWLQAVPVVSTRLLSTGVPLQINLPHGTQRFAYGTDMLVGTQQAKPLLVLKDSPIVFLGYGIDAPRWRWNDYRDVNVKGKTVIVLSGDPGYAGADPRLFNGRRGSRYGRRLYKYEQAALRGAAACFVIHSSAASGIPWTAVRNAATGVQQALPASAAPGPRLPAAGWLTHRAAERLFRAAGVSLKTLTAEAAHRGFQPVTLDATASITLRSSIRYSWSDNVLALLKGSRHPDQVVIYSAHWDGLGLMRTARGRTEVFHGAIANAGGVAALLEIADTFAHRKRPGRSVLFLMPTLEEAGQAGSRYYVGHPVFPLDETVADINIDDWPILGRARDMTVFGAGQSRLEDDLRGMLALQGRTPSPDAAPQAGLYYRSDQYSFARAGVPALLAGPGLDLIEGGRAAGEAALRSYLMRRYHTPHDVFDPHWHLGGTLEDIQTLYLVGRNLANGTQWPNWYPGSPYRALRDAMMAGRTRVAARPRGGFARGAERPGVSRQVPGERLLRSSRASPRAPNPGRSAKSPPPPPSPTRAARPRAR